MHIAILSVEYPPFVQGGVGTFANNLALGLRMEGVKITVISGYPASFRTGKTKIAENDDSGFEVIRYPYLNVHPKDLLFQLQNLKRICTTLKLAKPDIVHGQSLSLFPASIKLKKLAPIIVTFHQSLRAGKDQGFHSLLKGGSLLDFGTDVLGYPLMSYVARNELRVSKIAVAVSGNLRSDLIAQMGKTYRAKIHEIHNGIDLETLDSRYKDVEHDVEENTNSILFAGRLTWRKGPLLLIKFAHLLQKEKMGFKIIVHGDGPLLKRLQGKIKEYRLTNIELKGFATGARFMQSMRSSRFVIIPSYFEACPMALLEAMCLGKIPIMFDLPFSLEFAENGKYGILAKNTEDMVKQLKNAYENVDLKNYSDRIRDFARKKYNVKNMSLKYLELYKSVLG